MPLSANARPGQTHPHASLHSIEQLVSETYHARADVYMELYLDESA